MPNPPVVFIPGLGGSFNLQVLLDWRGPTTNGWRFPPFVDYGETFLNTFKQAGYRRGRDLFVAFYDWRKSVKDTVRDYLMPWIDQAKRRSGSSNVVLVAHSMGGLVARSYIQGSDYRRDVDRLITLGTPHRGAATAYFPWQGGEIRWDSTARVVIDVYLWYLEHIHPFQTGLDRLKTMRTQVPGVRDLLPIDDYLLNQAGQPKPEDLMQQRNVWSDIINMPENVDTLLERVPVTTINGGGFDTLQSLVVTEPPPTTRNPLRYPDGEPVSEEQIPDGDGTVLRTCAQINDTRVRNLDPVPVPHAALPDQMAGRILQELNMLGTSVMAESSTKPRLVILTASPLEVSVELPPEDTGVPEGMLGAARGPRSRRRRGKRRAETHNYGHRGKPLNMVVVPYPTTGVYNVEVHGTGRGAFALGSLLVGEQAADVLGANAEGQRAMPEPTATSIATVHGEVAVDTELHYQVRVAATMASPEIAFDAPATARNALARIYAAVQTTPPDVLGASEGVESSTADQVRGVLGATAGNQDVRAKVEAAVGDGDDQAMEEVTAMLCQPEGPHEARLLLEYITEHMISQNDIALAMGLTEQLKQIAILS